jgi:proteasome lid subunit RPN8/RPN11
MSDVKFGTWAVAESPITIEYSLVVIEEIRREVSEGFQKLSRGGIEVGGVLYGTRDGREVRLLAIRPIACEHARGPSFQLSDNDRAALEQQLAQNKEDPHLEGMMCLGWFLSHTRTEIALSDSDVEVFATYFPDPWHSTLVVRPGRGGSMRAGFFVREADGTINPERSYLEFNFPDRLAAIFDRGPRPERAPGEHRGGFGQAAAALAPRPTPDFVRSPLALPEQLPGLLAGGPPGGPGAQLEPAEPSRKWLWLVAWGLAVVLVAAFGVRYYLAQNITEPIALSIIEREGQLQIEWDPAARPVKNAAGASLEIIDGTEVHTIPLSPQHLAGGRFTYQRVGGDVQVRMTVEDSDGKKSLPVASQFLGPPPAKMKVNDQETTTLDSRRTALENEIARLRQENANQAGRIQQLERTLRILQTRLSDNDK